MSRMVAHNLAMQTVIHAASEGQRSELQRQSMDFKEFLRQRDGPFDGTITEQ
jgi:hypothetical protein